MAILWLVACITIELGLKPHSVEVDSGRSGATVLLTMNHLCCSGCLDDFTKSLNSLAVKPGIISPDDVLPPEEAGSADRGVADYSAPVILTLESEEDILALDFAQLDQALRAKGLVAGEMKLTFSRATHFRFVAHVGHMCCEACIEGAEEALVRYRNAALRENRFQWMNSIRVRKIATEADVDGEDPGGEIIAYVRYVEGENDPVDVKEFLDALDVAGFAANSIKIRLGEEDEDFE